MIPVTYKYDTNTYNWGGHIEDTRTEVFSYLCFWDITYIICRITIHLHWLNKKEQLSTDRRTW
jgi:hypothetical protein